MESQTKNLITTVILIVGLLVSSLLCANEAPETLKEQTIVDQIDNLLASKFTPEMPGAVVLVARDDQILFHRAYGLASVELGVPMSPDMVFALGSLTKKFTATAVLMLVDAGEIVLDDPISSYVHGLDKWGDKITIDHLLSHRSGVPDLFSEPRWIASWKDPATPQDLLAFFQDKELLFDPGSRAAYSNSNYVLLALALEKAAGMPFEQVIRDRILDPLKLKQTTFLVNSAITPGLVEGYQISTDGFEKPWYLHFSHLYGAGSMASAAGDLMRFHSALVSSRLIPKELLRDGFTPALLDDGSACAYARIGYVHTSQVKGHPGIDFSGAMLGFEVHEKFIAEDALYISVLSNISGGPMMENPYEPGPLAKRIAALVLGVSSPKPQAITLPQEELSRYVGVYELEADELRIITLENGQLFSQRSGGRKHRMQPISDTEFFYEGGDEARFLFRFDESGKAIEANWRNGAGQLSVGTRSDRALPERKQVVDLPDSAYEAITGHYEDSTGMTIDIAKSATGIIVTSPGMPPANFTPESATSFFLPDQGWSIDFTIDPDGQAQSLRMSMQGGRIQMEAARIQ